MATPPNSFQNTALKLYKDNKWRFTINDNLKCVMCQDILLDAIQTDCGCRYCKECIDNYLENGEKECVAEYEDCRSVITSYIYDRATNKEISLLKVKCLYEGCVFEDTLKSIKGHLDFCEYRNEMCSLCGMEYIIKEESNHLANECLLREVLCQYCRTLLTFKEYNESHLCFESRDLCGKYEAICPYGCTGESKVNLLHHRKSCENKPLECPLHVFDCKQLIPKDQMTEHLNTSSYEHTLTIVTELRKLEKQNKHMEERMNILIEENQLLKATLEVMKLDLPKNSGSISRDTSLKRANKTIFRNGKYMWKIKSFSKLRENAMRGKNPTILSEAFYTSDFGYKMCMKIYPCGDGVGKGTHLSIFFVIMKGDYDDILPWPFKNKVIITIFDDFSKSTNLSDTFKPDPKSICYQRPEEEYNIASGSPKFISFSELKNFLKKDTLYIQINVIA
uniref:TRAF-4 n=1 Tax=Dendrocoelum lacteum TaxID=27895 RepID=T1DBK6_9PLAT